MLDTIYDVIVIGAGPAGTQAAVSASHQMRHVLVLHSGKVSFSRGRAYWSKSVEIEDAPVFPGIIGPNFAKELMKWMESRPVVEFKLGDEQRKAGIDIKDGLVTKLTKKDDVFVLEASTSTLKKDNSIQLEQFTSRTVVVASGFDDKWPDIEFQPDENRLYKQYATVFRYAGNRKGWHVCIRCDGHLHVNEHLALLGVGDYIYEAAIGAQDFTEEITILTNGRPHGMSPHILNQLEERNIDIIETGIKRHIGEKTDLLGFEMMDGTELFFHGFLVDEGLIPNTKFLSGWDYQKDDEGLIIANEDMQMLDSEGNPIPGLYAAGDIISGERNLIATAFALGQEAGLSASDSLRKWHYPNS
ncbi:NAD(P)/FAD-dependent oxidoreductase [Candidatus Poribacteria bacterium]|nr:NAD(P)/FAD-dependent oxidoreductase [Candidatus Poribacteria bacterium]